MGGSRSDCCCPDDSQVSDGRIAASVRFMSKASEPVDISRHCKNVLKERPLDWDLFPHLELGLHVAMFTESR